MTAAASVSAPALPGGRGEAEWPPRAQGNYALALMILAFAFSFLDRVILSMVMVPIQQDLHFSDTQLALLHGFAFAIFYAAAGFPLGHLADTVSRKRLIAIGVCCWSLCTAACGLARGFASLFAARVGVGVGEAALSPAAFSLLSDYFRPERRARAIAIYQLGVTGGAGLAYVLGGLVIAFASSGQLVSLPVLGELAPWRVTFLIVGLPGLMIALAMLTIVEPRRREETAEPLPSRGAMRGWLAANRRVIACYALGYAAINVAFNAVIAWGPTWLTRVHGMGPAEIGLVLGAAMLFAGGIGQVLGARRSDRRLAAGRRTAVLDTGVVCALCLVPLSLATVAPALALAVPMIGAMFFFVCAAIGHAPALIGQIAPNRLRGRVAAIFLCALNIVGTGLGPFAVALLTDNVFADPAMVGVSMTITAFVGALAGAALLAAGRSALAAAPAQPPVQGA